jgi:hypothetical protein
MCVSTFLLVRASGIIEFQNIYDNDTKMMIVATFWNELPTASKGTPMHENPRLIKEYSRECFKEMNK